MSDLELTMMRRVGELKAENARLKAEVERLDCKLTRLLRSEKEWILVEPQEFSRLEAEITRLRKAGDAVVADLEHLTKSGWFDKCKSVKRWNAAKEGKPQP
jgi:predicted RNase H-like nuclease (RuvC/YqgF family)